VNDFIHTIILLKVISRRTEAVESYRQLVRQDIKVDFGAGSYGISRTLAGTTSRAAGIPVGIPLFPEYQAGYLGRFRLVIRAETQNHIFRRHEDTAARTGHVPVANFHKDLSSI
jgi:hypothetical protein